ncbi:MAG: RNA-binding protein [Victivallales bacterium]|nr:RNA-binding protein [Victivallales bacterium]
MGKNLYVGNLSYSVKDDELNALFAAFGKVTSARVIMDRETQRSKGFGFVEMENDAEAQAAIDALNGKENNGRQLTVNEARPREPRSGFGGRSHDGGSRH